MASPQGINTTELQHKCATRSTGIAGISYTSPLTVVGRAHCLRSRDLPFMIPLLLPHLLHPLLEGPDSKAQMKHNLLQLETARAAREDARESRKDDLQRRGNDPGLTLTKLQEGNDDVKASLTHLKLWQEQTIGQRNTSSCTSFGLLLDAGMLAVANLPARTKQNMTKLNIHSCLSMESPEIVVHRRYFRSRLTLSTWRIS